MTIKTKEKEPREMVQVDYSVLRALRWYAIEHSTHERKLKLKDLATQAIKEFLERNCD